MLQQPPYSEYCARCSKCLDDEPVPIRCEICNQQICNNCRSIDNKKRTIIATSLTKSGGGKQPSGRLLNLIGSKLSVLTAFRSSLSKSSFEFDELEEEEQLSNTKNRRPQSATSQHGNDNEFDKYFEQQNRQYSERYYQDRHLDDRNDKYNELDKQKSQLNQNLLDKHQFKHNKIEKQMSFQYTSERRRRLSNFKTGDQGGSLDIDNSKTIGNLLTVPIDQQQKQSHSDSSLNRQNSIDQQSRIRTNSSDQMNRLSQFDLNNNNNLYQSSMNRSHQKLNRMVSLDDRSVPIQQQIPKIIKSPIHLPLERSNTIDCNYDNQLMKPCFKDNLKSNDFILSICVMCAKNFRSTSGGEWMKKITRSASEKLRRSGSISRTLINRSGLMKAQSNLMTNQNPIINTESNILQTHHTAQYTPTQKHRHSTDAGSLISSSTNSNYLEQNLNNLELNNKLDNNNLSIFKSSMPPSSGSLTVTTSSSASNVLRTAHTQLTHVNSSPLPSAAHRLHQPVFNQSSQPIAIKSHQLSNYKSPPPPPSTTPTPNLLTQQQQSTLTQQTNEYDLNQNYFLNQNLNQFDNSNMTTLEHQKAYVEQPYVDPTASITMQTKSIYLTSNALANNNNINQSSYITPKYVRSNLINKKLPVLDCSKISSVNNPLVQQQQQFSTPVQQHTYNQPYRNPLSSTYNHIKSPPSSGSSLETNSPRSIMTTINSSANSSPHLIHQSQSNFSTNANVSQSNFNQGQSNIPIGNNINNIGSGPANILNNSLNVMGKVISDLVSSDTRSAAIQELRETVYRKVSTRFRSSSSTSSSSTSSSCSLSNYPSIDSHHVYHPSANLYNAQQLQSIQQQQQQQPPLPPSQQNIYHPLTTATNNLADQNNTTGQLATVGRQTSGRQLPHIPGQQTFYQFHNQLNKNNQYQNMINDPLESNSPSPKTPSRSQSSKFMSALNNSSGNIATAFRFPPVINNSPPIASNLMSNTSGSGILHQPPHSPLKQQSSDEFSTTMSSHRSRSSSSDIGYGDEQPISPIPQNLQGTQINRHTSLQANLRTDSARNRRVSPLRKQRAIHLIDDQQHYMINMSQNYQTQDEQGKLIATNNSASAGCSPLHQPLILSASSTVKTQRSGNLIGFNQTQNKLQQAKSFTMLQQPQQSQANQHSSGKDENINRWNWRENKVAASANGLFRCKSACETNIEDKQEDEATIEPRTGCVFRKMTIKRKDRSYHALEVNNEQQHQINQPRKLSFNPELEQTNTNSPMLTSAQQIANFFKEPVHKSHSEDSKANRYKNKETILHNGSSGSDPLIHRKKLGSFLPHISVSDYSANSRPCSRRPSAIEDNLENADEKLLNNRLNSNNLFSSDASQTSTSRTSLHEQLSSSNSSSALGSTTASNVLSNSSTFDGEYHQQNSTHHLQQPLNNKQQRRNSSENKLNPNALIYRQSRSLSNSAHSQEIEDQLLEKSFYSQPTLVSKNVSVDRLYPVLNSSKQKQALAGNQNTFGEILVSVYYNNRISTLEIKVKEAKNLVPVDSTKLSSMIVNQIIKTSSQNTTSDTLNVNQPVTTKPTNPYVKTYLLPDRSSSSKRKTRAKSDTLNPIFNDLLSYIVDCKDIHNRTLWLTVWHEEKFGPNQFLGELILSLDNYNLSDSEYKWYPLKRRTPSKNFLIDLPLKKTSWPQLDSSYKND